MQSCFPLVAKNIAAAVRRWLHGPRALQVMATDRSVRLLFVVTALLFLPLEFTQLALAIAGACIYTFIQHASADQETWWPRKKSKAAPARRMAPKVNKAWPPALPGQCWEADVQLLLSQITPTSESENAAQRLVETVKRAIQPLFPEADVCGFVSGELEGSRANLNIPTTPFSSIGRIGQEIDSTKGIIANVIEYRPSSLASGLKEAATEDALVQRVYTEYTVSSENSVELQIRGLGVDPQRVFGFEVPEALKLKVQGPLSLPFGNFEVLYLDEEIRIIRTGQGWYSVNRRGVFG